MSWKHRVTNNNTSKKLTQTQTHAPLTNGEDKNMSVKEEKQRSEMALEQMSYEGSFEGEGRIRVAEFGDKLFHKRY